MREQTKQTAGESPIEQTLLGGSDGPLPIIASARTGLAGKDDAILRRIPAEYSGKSVREAIDYLVGADLTDSELPLAESLKKELGARGNIVVINGKTAKLGDTLEQYLVTKTHTLPDRSVKQYRELEIEVSAVQQGGLYSLLK